MLDYTLEENIKRIMIGLLLLSISVSILGQEIDTVITVDSTTKSVLFNRAQRWFVSNVNDSSEWWRDGLYLSNYSRKVN